MEKNMKNTEALKTMKKMIEDIRFCMLATSDTRHVLYGRPMTTMDVDEDGNIWFFTSTKTDTAKDAKQENEVCLNYAEPSEHNYLTVQGSATLVHDKTKMKALWNPMLKAYFPEGLDAPDLVLLRIEPTKAHYWDSNGNKLVNLFEMVKAAVTGDDTDLGRHGELRVD